MFRFSIRDLLWLTILAAILVAWWIQWRSDVIARHRDAQAIQQLKQQLANRPVIRFMPISQPPRRLRFPPEKDYQAPPIRPETFEEYRSPRMSKD
jgi:hypothetical protein